MPSSMAILTGPFWVLTLVVSYILTFVAIVAGALCGISECTFFVTEAVLVVALIILTYAIAGNESHLLVGVTWLFTACFVFQLENLEYIQGNGGTCKIVGFTSSLLALILLTWIIVVILILGDLITTLTLKMNNARASVASDTVGATQVRVPDSGYPLRAKVMYSYTANSSDPKEMSLTKGDVIEVAEASGKWWQARRSDGRTGIVPSNYVQLIK